MATVDLTATVTMTDESTADVTAEATWTSSAPAVATVAAGTVTSVGEGTATITAEYEELTSTSAITVTLAPPTPQSLAVTPATASLEHEA